MRPNITGPARDGLRAHNQNAILQLVHRQGPISRSDIAVKLSLSPAAVTNITNDLIGKNLIYEARQAEPGGVGRRAILLEVDYDHAVVAGVKVSNAGVTCAATNLNAEVTRIQTHALADTEPDTVLDVIAKALFSLSHELGRQLEAIGINLPGIVDPDHKTIRYSPLLGWEQVPFGQRLEERLSLPVLVENDVNALAHAHAWFGHGLNHDSFLVVTLGRGVGLGIVLNGKVYRGPHGGAGEFGHIVLDQQGPDRPHSKRGTVEAHLSDDALLRDARARIQDFPNDATPETLAALALSGDSDALAIYEAAGAVLGRALSILVNIFAPSLIILSGEGMRGADFFLPATRAALEEHSFGDLTARLKLVVNPWGDDAWARGAAGLAASRYLTEAATRSGGD